MFTQFVIVHTPIIICPLTMISTLLSCRCFLFSDYIRPTTVRSHSSKVSKLSKLLSRLYLEKKLGPAPKRPLKPYFLYMQEIRPSVSAEHPTLAGCDFSVHIGKMWNALGEAGQEKYYKAFADENIRYWQQFHAYNEKVTEDDKRKLCEKRMELAEEMEKREKVSLQRKEAAALQRPMKPQTGFFRFHLKHNDRKANEKVTDFVQRKSSEWKRLTDCEKDAYKPSVEDWENYKNDYLAWKWKMKCLGKEHLGRIKRHKQKTFEDILSSEKS